MKRSHCTGRGAMASLYVPPFASLHNSSWHSKESLREAKGNLRLQPLDAHTQSLDGRLQPACKRRFQHAAWDISARSHRLCSTLRMQPQRAGGKQASPRRLFRTMPTAGHQCTASLCDAGCGAALMMRQKKDRSVTERFVAACLWAAQPDEASPVTERLLM